jgi:integrase
MNRLQRALEDYLRVRRALGFRLEREASWLPQFVAFLAAQRSSCITAALALRWAVASPSGAPGPAQARLRMVRGFARYLAAFDPRTEVPSSELLPARPSARPIPYIYADQEVCALIQATHTLQGLKATTYATLIGLLAVTGMRVGEAIALNRDAIDEPRSVLVIQDGKFGKSRELVVHPTTTAALRAYAVARDRALPRPGSRGLLLSLSGRRLLYKNVHPCFMRLIRAAGLAKRRPRPRLHDLRHTFAVTTLVRWYRDGVDVEARLPALSTYLGHVAPSSTYWYLTATPELLELARQRAQHRMESPS